MDEEQVPEFYYHAYGIRTVGIAALAVVVLALALFLSAVRNSRKRKRPQEDK